MCACIASSILQSPYSSPVPLEMYGHLAVGLLLAGLLFLAAFFDYEMGATKATRSLSRELPLAVASSLLLGFGGLFATLWAGVYV
jgi:Oligosaccharyltransferase subunit 5